MGIHRSKGRIRREAFAEIAAMLSIVFVTVALSTAIICALLLSVNSVPSLATGPNYTAVGPAEEPGDLPLAPGQGPTDNRRQKGHKVQRPAGPYQPVAYSAPSRTVVPTPTPTTTVTPTRTKPPAAPAVPPVEEPTNSPKETAPVSKPEPTIPPVEVPADNPKIDKDKPDKSEPPPREEPEEPGSSCPETP